MDINFVPSLNPKTAEVCFFNFVDPFLHMRFCRRLHPQNPLVMGMKRNQVDEPQEIPSGFRKTIPTFDDKDGVALRPEELERMLCGAQRPTPINVRCRPKLYAIVKKGLGV